MNGDSVHINGKNKKGNSKSKFHFGSDSSSKFRKLHVDSHPMGIKPLGNRLISVSGRNLRDVSFGNLRMLDDRIIFGILETLEDYMDLIRLNHVCKAFFVFSQADSLWKPFVLEAFEGNFRFQGSWKKTFVFETLAKKGINQIPPFASFVIEDFFSDVIFNQWYCVSVDLMAWSKYENIDRRDNLSLEEFVEQYEKPNKPVIITDIVKNWDFSAWSKEKMMERYGETPFKTDQGVSMSLKDYFQYCSGIKEVSPMYLFDNTFAEKCPELFKGYEIPKYFKEDFFSLLQGNDRPSFRWILVGPPRSGSSFHKDPNFTSAWNGLFSGCKKWILYPPEEVPPGVHPSEDGWEVETPEGVIEWFIDFYPETKKPGAYQPVEAVMKPGDLIFIPSSWWHTALNLEESIAVTQNYVSQQNLLNVNAFLKSKPSSELYDAFHSALVTNHPEISEGLEEKMKEMEKKNKKKRKKAKDSTENSFWKKLTQEGENQVSFSLF